MLNATTTGNLHAGDGETLDVVVGKDGSKLFCVVHIVQLRAAHQGDSVADKLLVEVAIGKGTAVSCNQEVCSFKVGGIDWNQLDLHWPLTQLAYWYCACCRAGG